MNPAAAAPRRIHHRLAAYLWPGTLVALLLGSGLLVVALLQRHAPGGLPWQAALAIAALAWLSCTLVIAPLALQSVRLHADGRIDIRGPGTGFRRRSFHAAEVKHVLVLRWTQVYRSPAARLLLQLNAAPARRWSMIGVVDDAPFGRGDGALFQAVLAAITQAQPGRPMPVVPRRGRS